MQDTYFKTIYNIPEEISGLGCIAHFIGLCLFPALGLFVIPDMFADNSLLKGLIQDIISAGMLVTLGFAFIFIVCPIYFFCKMYYGILSFIFLRIILFPVDLVKIA